MTDIVTGDPRPERASRKPTIEIKPDSRGFKDIKVRITSTPSKYADETSQWILASDH